MYITDNSPARRSISRDQYQDRRAADPCVSTIETCLKRVIGIVPGTGGGDGATELRALEEHGGASFFSHPEGAALPLMSRPTVAADHPNPCPPIPGTVRFVGSFRSCHRPLRSGLHPWDAARWAP